MDTIKTWEERVQDQIEGDDAIFFQRHMTSIGWYAMQAELTERRDAMTNQSAPVGEVRYREAEASEQADAFLCTAQGAKPIKLLKRSSIVSEPEGKPVSELLPCPFCGSEATTSANNTIGCPICHVWVGEHRRSDWNRQSRQRGIPERRSDQPDAQSTDSHLQARIAELEATLAKGTSHNLLREEIERLHSQLEVKARENKMLLDQMDRMSGSDGTLALSVAQVSTIDTAIAALSYHDNKFVAEKLRDIIASAVGNQDAERLDFMDRMGFIGAWPYGGQFQVICHNAILDRLIVNGKDVRSTIDAAMLAAKEAK